MFKFFSSVLVLILSATSFVGAVNRPIAIEGTMGENNVRFRLDLAYDEGCLVWGKSYYLDEEGETLSSHDVYGTYNKRLLAANLVGYLTFKINEYNESSEILGAFNFNVDECDNYKNRKLWKGGYWQNADSTLNFRKDVDVVVAKPMLAKPSGDDLFRRNISLNIYRTVNDTLVLKNNSDVIFQDISILRVPELLPTQCQRNVDTLVARNTYDGLTTMFEVTKPDQWYPHANKSVIDVFSEGKRYVSMSVIRRLFYRGNLASTEYNYYTYNKLTGEYMTWNNFFVMPNNPVLRQIITDEFAAQCKVQDIFNDPQYRLGNPVMADDEVMFYYHKGDDNGLNGFGKCLIPVSKISGYFTYHAKSFLIK